MSRKNSQIFFSALGHEKTALDKKNNAVLVLDRKLRYKRTAQKEEYICRYFP
jgi:hypothetical protein